MQPSVSTRLRLTPLPLILSAPNKANASRPPAAAAGGKSEFATVEAVYDRRQSRRFEIVGGHRSPLQLREFFLRVDAMHLGFGIAGSRDGLKCSLQSFE